MLRWCPVHFATWSFPNIGEAELDWLWGVLSVDFSWPSANPKLLLKWGVAVFHGQLTLYRPFTHCTLFWNCSAAILPFFLFEREARVLKLDRMGWHSLSEHQPKLVRGVARSTVAAEFLHHFENRPKILHPLKMPDNFTRTYLGSVHIHMSEDCRNFFKEIIIDIWKHMDRIMKRKAILSDNLS